MKARWFAWGLVLAFGLGTTACDDKRKDDDKSEDDDGGKKKKKKKKKKDDDGLSLKLDKDSYEAGDTIEVDFGEALPAKDDKHWLTLVKQGSPDNEWGNWHIVESGAKSDQLVTSEGGDFEVRLHSKYPDKSHNVIAKKKVTVKGEPSLISLSSTTVKKGQKIRITYTKPLPPDEGKYWITIVKADDPPSAWGTWHYVKKGATSDEVPTPATGRMEVRLHGLYPRRQHNIIAKKLVTVE